MAALLTDPFGRQLLSLLTADFGVPGDASRHALLHELLHLERRAKAKDAPRQVKNAIRSALSAMRVEFSTADPGAPAGDSR